MTSIALDCIVLAVAHDAYRQLWTEDISALFQDSAGAAKVLVDVKGIRTRAEAAVAGWRYWRF